MISVRKLKRRKLAQWSIAYLAGAWLLLQVLELVVSSQEIGLLAGVLVLAGVVHGTPGALGVQHAASPNAPE